MSEPVRGTQFLNINATVVNLTAGIASIAHLRAVNSSAAIAWVQFFDLAAADVTAGTTKPLFEVPLAATSGSEDIDFGHPMIVRTRLSVLSATASEGGTGSADGVKVMVWVV